MVYQLIEGSLGGTFLLVVQFVLLVVGILLAFAGERIHEIVITLGGLLLGAAIGLTVVPAVLFADASGVTGFGSTALSVVVTSLVVATLVWLSIYYAVFLSGAAAGLVFGASLTGVWSPLWIGGGLLAGAFAVLFSVILACGVAFVAAYFGQATGLYGLRDYAFRINSAFRGVYQEEPTRSNNDEKFRDGELYFEDGGSGRKSSSKEYPIIPEDTVRNSGTIRATVLTVVGIVCFGFMALMFGLLLGAPILGVVLHPMLRGGFVVVLLSIAFGRIALLLYRPYIALSTALSGAFLIAYTVTSQRLLARLLEGDVAAVSRLVRDSSLTLLLVFVLVFLSGAAVQLWHIHHSDAPVMG